MVLIALSVITLLFCLLKPRSKSLWIIVSCLIFIIMGLNTYNPDTPSYQLIFNSPQNAQEEMGYRILNQAGRALGMSYEIFHAVIIVLGMLIMLRGFQNISKNDGIRYPAFALALYLIHPIAMDTVLVRQFLAGAVVICGVAFLMSNTDKENNFVKTALIYVGIIGLASTIHISSIFFLIFLLYRISSRKIIIAVAVTTGAVVVSLKFGVIQSLITHMLSNDKKVLLMMQYGKFSIRALLIDVGFLSINYFSIIFMKINCTERKNLGYSHLQSNLSFTEISQIYLKINVLSFALIPFLLLSDQYLRLVRLMMVINFSYYQIAINHTIGRRSRLLKAFLAIAGVLCILCWKMTAYTSGNQNYWQYVFMTVYDNNVLWGG